MASARSAERPATSACSLIPLRRIDDPRGSLCAVEVGERIPFEIQRAFWVFDVPEGRKRGDHAHREQWEVLIAARGRFTVHCDDGVLATAFTLVSPDTGLLIPPMVFHYLEEFSPGALCLALASGPYDASEYVCDRAEFELLRGKT